MHENNILWEVQNILEKKIKTSTAFKCILLYFFVLYSLCMCTKIIFQEHTVSSNGKVQGTVLILKTWEKVRYLDVFCYKAIAMFTSAFA